MIKSITESREYKLCKESPIKRTFESVQLNTHDAELFKIFKKYEYLHFLMNEKAKTIYSD